MVAIGLSTLRHLWFGLRALLFLRIDRQQMRTIGPEPVLLGLLAILTDCVQEYVLAGPGSEFVSIGLNVKIAGVAVLVGGLTLVGARRLSSSMGSFLATVLAVGIWANVPTLITVGLAPYVGLSVASSTVLAVYVGLVSLAIMLAAIFVIGMRATLVRPRRFGLAAVAAVLASVSLPIIEQFKSLDLAELFAKGGAETATASLPRLAPVDVEAVYAHQPALIDAALDRVTPSRSDRPEVYFVGMAPYSGQDVFKREITSAREIVDQRFDTVGRSIVMINHRETIETHALANATNLERVLWRLAQRMNLERDFLVLYITTHGSEGELSVSFPRFSMNDITPEKLAAMLARTGIRNRVIILSACHSGSFVPALSDPDTLVMAAARTDRASFGCSNERDWTYFGDALFNHALRETRSFVDGFERAKSLVSQWETDQKLEPASEPQMSVGANIAPKLADLARRLDVEVAARDKY
jgi:Peptidase C13 family